MDRISELMRQGIFSVGKHCPPGGHCNVQGKQNADLDLEGTAELKDKSGRIVSKSKFQLTIEFIKKLESIIPEGLYSWYPPYSGGEIIAEKKIEEFKKIFNSYCKIGSAITHILT